MTFLDRSNESNLQEADRQDKISAETLTENHAAMHFNADQKSLQSGASHADRASRPAVLAILFLCLTVSSVGCAAQQVSAANTGATSTSVTLTEQDSGKSIEITRRSDIAGPLGLEPDDWLFMERCKATSRRSSLLSLIMMPIRKAGIEPAPAECRLCKWRPNRLAKRNTDLK